MRRAGLLIVFAVVAVAAGRAPPSQAIASRARPARPTARAPRPSACPTLAPAAPSQATADAPPLAVSSIAVSIPIPLAALRRELDRLIPNLSDPGWPEPHQVAEGVCATWFFDRRPVGLTMDGPRLRVTIPGGFGVIADPHTDLLGCSPPFVRCGDKTAGAAPLPVEIRLSTPVSIDRHYRIAAALQNDGTALLQPCNVVGNVVDATPTIRGILDGLIAQQATAWNAAISSKSDFRPQVQAAWSAIQRPQRVGDDLWLVVHPTELGGGVSAPDPDTISVQAIARGAIELVKQPAAPAVTAAPLPDLTPAPPGIAPGIHVGASGSISYDQLTKQLESQLVGTPQDIEYPAGVRHHIAVRGVRVAGPVECKTGRRRNRCVSVAVEITGDGCGVVYLVGKPAVDAETQEIAVQDLELSVETSNALVNKLSWFAHAALLDRVKRELRVSLASATADARQRLDRALHSKLAGDWRLSGGADSVALHVSIGAAGLDYAIDLSGTLAVNLSP